jgi:hypothetical protein
MRKVVRKSFFDEMVLLESTKCMLENRFLRAGLKSLQEFINGTCPLTLDEQQVGCRFEFERCFCLNRAEDSRGGYRSLQTTPCLLVNWNS